MKSTQQALVAARKGVAGAPKNAAGGLAAAGDAILAAPAAGGACVAVGFTGTLLASVYLPILIPLFLMLLMVGAAVSWASYGLIPSSEADAREAAWWNNELPAPDLIPGGLQHAKTLSREYPDPLTAETAIKDFYYAGLTAPELERKLDLAAQLVPEGEITDAEHDEYDALAAKEAYRLNTADRWRGRSALLPPPAPTSNSLDKLIIDTKYQAYQHRSRDEATEAAKYLDLIRDGVVHGYITPREARYSVTNISIGSDPYALNSHLVPPHHIGTSNHIPLYPKDYS